MSAAVDKAWEDFVVSLPADIDATELALRLAAEGLGFVVKVYGPDAACRVALDVIDALKNELQTALLFSHFEEVRS